MATTTENLGMTLPATTDPVDVTVLNGNFSTLDAFAGQQAAKDTEQDDAIAAKMGLEDVYGMGTTIPASTDLDTLTDCGRYFSPNAATSGTLTNCPFPSGGFLLITEYGTATMIQNLWPTPKAQAGTFFSRRYGSGTWGAWYKFTGEVVS